MQKTGRHAIIEQFLADGMNHMFGNPGTVEQGFLDALADYPEMRYVLTLQESIAVMAADGYARSTQRPTLVQIHSTPGLGNSIGALYQAMRGHAPLVVIGGDAGIKSAGMDAQMASRSWYCGPAEGMIEYLKSLERSFPGLEAVNVQASMGTPESVMVEQLHRFAEEVMPEFSQ